VDDVPNSFSSVLSGAGTGEGFKTDNAYFYGANKLNALTYTKQQICGGYRSTVDGCPVMKCYDLEDSWVQPGGFDSNVNNADFNKDMSKAFACIAGGGTCGSFMSMNHGTWRFPTGHAAEPAAMSTYGEATTGNLVWSCRGYQLLYGWHSQGWHFQGWGWSAELSSSGQELMMYDSTCGNNNHDEGPNQNSRMDYMNLIQIRVHA